MLQVVRGVTSVHTKEQISETKGKKSLRNIKGEGIRFSDIKMSNREDLPKANTVRANATASKIGARSLIALTDLRVYCNIDKS